MFTLALAVFFFFETAIAGIKSASVYVENDSAGGKRSGILKPGIGGKSLALQGGSKRLRIPLAPYKFRNQTRNPVLNPSRDVVTRGGMWSQTNLKDWVDLQKRKLGTGRFFVFNIVSPSHSLVGSPVFSFVQMGGGGPGGPPGTGRNPWELGGSGFGYWWTKPSTNPRQGDKEMYRPSRSEVVSSLIGATYFYFWGHGGGGTLKLGKEYLTPEDVLFVAMVRRFFGRPKMKKAELRACESVSTAAALNAWLLISEEVEGYTGLTGDWIRGLIPVIYRSHSFTQPVIDDPKGNINDKISKKNDKKSGAVTKKNSKLRKK